MDHVRLGSDNGTLRLHTGVEGRAARLGHALVLAVADWSAEAVLVDGLPTSARLRAGLASLSVESGSGGAKPLTDRDRRTIRSTALESLRAAEHPEVVFVAGAAVGVPGGLGVDGELTIGGRTQPVTVQVKVAETPDGWLLAARTTVRQSDFGVTPYSTMLGALRLGDAVEVTFEAAVARP